MKTIYILKKEQMIHWRVRRLLNSTTYLRNIIYTNRKLKTGVKQ